MICVDSSAWTRLWTLVGLKSKVREGWSIVGCNTWAGDEVHEPVSSGDMIGRGGMPEGKAQSRQVWDVVKPSGSSATSNAGERELQLRSHFPGNPDGGNAT